MNRAAILQLRDAVNATGTLDATAACDNLAAVAPAASVQLLPGDRWAKRYVNDTGAHEQPFAVNYRVGGANTSERVDAAAALSALADALEAGNPHAFGRITGTDTPSLVERDDHGQETWRVTFVLESDVR